jgi:hypothetical protein
MVHRRLIKDMLQLIEAARILIARATQPECNARSLVPRPGAANSPLQRFINANNL